MNKLKKEFFEIKIGQKFEAIKGGEFFTKGRIYRAIEVDFDPATNQTEIAVKDDENQDHWMDERWWSKNFIIK